MAHSICEWQVKLCDRSLARATPGRLRDASIMSCLFHTYSMYSYAEYRVVFSTGFLFSFALCSSATVESMAISVSVCLSVCRSVCWSFADDSATRYYVLPVL